MIGNLNCTVDSRINLDVFLLTVKQGESRGRKEKRRKKGKKGKKRTGSYLQQDLARHSIKQTT